MERPLRVVRGGFSREMHLSPDLADEKRTSGVKSRGQGCSDRRVGRS